MTDTRVRTARRIELEDQRAFLEASLSDAAREHEAGDLSDDDYVVLRRRDQARLDEVTVELAAEAQAPAAVAKPAPRAGRTASTSRRPLVLVLAGVALVIIGAVVLVVHLTSQRLPGETPSGSVQLSQAQQINQELGQAGQLLAANDVTDAVKLYSEVLTQDPHDPAALAQLGWLTYEEGVDANDAKSAAAGTRLVQEAVTADAQFGPAHLYDGVILLGTAHDPAGAVSQFRLFLAEQPSKQNLKNGAPFIRKAFQEDGNQPVPSEVPAS